MNIAHLDVILCTSALICETVSSLCSKKHTFNMIQHRSTRFNTYLSCIDERSFTSQNACSFEMACLKSMLKTSLNMYPPQIAIASGAHSLVLHSAVHGRNWGIQDREE